MKTLPEPEQYTQEHAVEIVAAALDVLRTRDAVPLTHDQVIERARNVIAALGAGFELVPLDRVAGLREAVGDFRAAVVGMRDVLQSEARR